MGYRDRSTGERAGGYNYCMMEVRLKKKDAPQTAKEDLRVLMVDSHWETLRFVQDNMEECIGNIVRLKRLESKAAVATDSAELFAQKLQPLMATLASVHGGEVMDKMSASLKKALLLMVMERYQSDRATACRVLGISAEKLDNELKLCGVAP